MARVEANVSVSVLDSDKVATLVDLLEKNIDLLPVELQEQLKEVADCDRCEIDRECISAIPGDVNCSIKSAKSVNKILKRVTLADGLHIYPETFLLTVGDNVIVSW